MKTLQDIYNYLNDRLLEGNLGGLKEVIDYLNEGQMIITQKFPVEAPIYTHTLTENKIPLPQDLETLKKVVRNGRELTIVDMWGGYIYLDPNIVDGVAYVYYYKTPSQLDETNPAMIPDIDSRYFYSLAKFAAEMYYLVDDDPEMREAFRAKFYDGLTSLNPKNSVSKFSNFF